jgi:hypothetical protein
MIDPYLLLAEDAAKTKGLRIVLPRDCELFVDIDSAHDLAVFEKAIDIVKEHAQVVDWVKNPSPSGKPHHFHITVSLGIPVKDAFERIMLQTLLGSDRTHELLSWRTAVQGGENPSLFRAHR